MSNKYEDELERYSRNTSLAQARKDSASASTKARKGPLKEHLENVLAVIGLLKDKALGNYNGQIPAGVIAALCGAIAYIASPIDLVPDIIPAAGLADDAAVFVAAFGIASRYVEAYRQWKKNQH